jgi:hypothetical protein
MERIDDGEVSPYLTGELAVGDELELRGPIGRLFHLACARRRAAAAHRRRVGPGAADGHAAPSRSHASTVDARLLVSSRSPGDVLYRDELATLATPTGLTIHHITAGEDLPDPSTRGCCARSPPLQYAAHGSSPPDPRRSSAPSSSRRGNEAQIALGFCSRRGRDGGGPASSVRSAVDARRGYEGGRCA